MNNKDKLHIKDTKITQQMKRDNLELKKLEQVIEDNPSVPSEVFDIEPSQEMAEAYHDMFGY